ncbi:aminotransferase class I/II-fold pyridoxal phosphate-dependent enzyme [Pseudalkalibacillus decolorationis]|uniref:aminotransferase class I/II-fold pyridoxal phosphate-dependent enzyme n=1 Tax=Pseudalkalibacillus decolorationis TaxID=163879 RepID=UPI002147D8F7|nr:aminotransferase class I/II-fold pyridoxal phosphate-dependent enzyme [Pseudalkalibacillus decolorationis]
MKYVETPLIDRLWQHNKDEAYSFHVPGHKNGQLWPKTEWAQNLLSLDVTELSGLDDLHDPTSVIKDAEDMTARLYGADYSYFLVNGTTVGNLAMIMTACPQGSKVLVQRNCHKSVINGINLSGAKPVYITPEVDHKTGVATGVTYERIKSAFEQHGSFSAVILTNPNYYGMTIDLTSIIKYVHQKDIPVLVDEAHGAHFGIGEPFPPSALEMGADVVVQSAHKTLPAMTMASFLHIHSSRINRMSLEKYLNILQSSSPSYPLMASLDFARAYRESIEKDDRKVILRSIDTFSELLKGIPQLEVIQGKSRYDWLDPLKLIIQSKTHLSGFKLQTVLEEQGIYTELADPYNVLFVLPLAPLREVSEIVARMTWAVKNYDVIESKTCNATIMNGFPHVTEQILTEHQIRQRRKTYVSLKEATGKICAETIIPYPPGIPILLAGERIMKAQVEYFQLLIENGARFQGASVQGRKLQIVE